jgi:ligand-binding SRPBCC domain-containing protein
VIHWLVEWPLLKSTMLAAFRHEHRVAAGEGGTLYTDRVTYSVIGGALTEALLVNAYMRRIFEVRHRNMLRLLR